MTARTRPSRSWQVLPALPSRETLARDVGSSPLAVQVMHNRGVVEPTAMKAFLAPRFDDLLDPALLDGAPLAAQRIAQAIRNSERIVIYGDYDVDGTTATALLLGVLKALGAQVSFYIPHRLEEGYGLHAEAVTQLIDDGAQLIVTVDCGVTAGAIIDQCNAAGVDVIITDHHIPHDTLPAAAAIVHPALGGSAYPNPYLCGAGVAFKLAWQVAKEVSGTERVDETMRRLLLDATALATLGTIADCMPLLDENRAMVVHGLKLLSRIEHPGLRALLDSANLTNRDLAVTDIAFRIGPRLNAAGRMGHADEAVALLTCRDTAEARSLAAQLERLNTTRQEVERAITAEAVEMARDAGMDDDMCGGIVLASENWHGGVIGIVASRLVDRFHKPAILIAVNGDGIGQGSGRSVEGFHLHDAIMASQDMLLSAGGHAMAAGLKIAVDTIPDFTRAFTQYTTDHPPIHDAHGALLIDAEVTIAELTYPTVEHLERLAPFGTGNAEPVLAIRDAQLVTAPQRMGRRGQHAHWLVRQGNRSIRVVAFGMGNLVEDLAGVKSMDLAGTPVLNRFNGQAKVELHLKDLQWT
jgi:single-stranded-DNA-specific exonuclease